MRYKDYEALLKTELADKNLLIQGFAMVFPTSSLTGKPDIRQFVSQKPSRKSPFLVGESYTWITEDNRSDNKQKTLDGAFWILHDVGTDKANFEKRADINDLCESIAEDCMSKLYKIYRDRQTPYVNWLSLVFDGEFTPLIDDQYYGVRIGFKISVPFNQQLKYDTAKWQA